MNKGSYWKQWLTVALIVIGWFTIFRNFPLWGKILICTGIMFFVYQIIPRIRLALSLSGETVSERDIMLELRADSWKSSPEIKRGIEERKDIQNVSLSRIIFTLNTLRNGNRIEMRERSPSEPSIFGTGNLMEFRRIT